MSLLPRPSLPFTPCFLPRGISSCPPPPTACSLCPLALLTSSPIPPAPLLPPFMACFLPPGISSCPPRSRCSPSNTPTGSSRWTTAGQSALRLTGRLSRAQACCMALQATLNLCFTKVGVFSGVFQLECIHSVYGCIYVCCLVASCCCCAAAARRCIAGFVFVLLERCSCCQL